MEGPISFWGYKEKESNLILPEHDDDDDDKLRIKKIIVLGPSETERLFTNCVLKTINKTIHIHFRSAGFCTQNTTNIPFRYIQ